VWLQTPNYSESHKQLAVAFRKKQRMTTLVHQVSGVKRQVGYGCQLTWSPDESYLYFVDTGGRMGNKIVRYDLKTREKTTWLDMPGAYSHEYFPKVSNTGDYMVFGASTGGHAHDSADYELFIWRLNAPVSEVVRITYHTGNDNWPDIYLK
jgi:Tol biopolymer transport system component